MINKFQKKIKQPEETTEIIRFILLVFFLVC